MPGSSSYPTGLDNFAESSPTNLGDSDGTGRTHSERHDDVEASIEAIEGELGTTPSGVYPTVAARLDAIAGAGTASISLNAGTATAPSFYFTSDTNTGIWSPGADTLAVSTGGTERLRVASNGNVGIGATSEGYRLHIRRNDASGVVMIENTDTSVGYNTDIYVNNSNVAGNLLLTRRANGEFWIYQSANLPISLYPNNAERFRIAGDGLITGTGTSLGAWTAYTPTLGGTGWALGDGTLTGAYCQIGKIVHFRGEILFGSTSTFGAGALTIALPVTAKSSTQNAAIARFRDVSTSTNILGVARSFTTSTLGFGYNNATPAETGITTNAPFTWANGDFIYFSGTYEAA